MKCPLTQLECKGKTCFQIKSETGFIGNLIGCEKSSQVDIYITDKDGKLVKV